MPNLTLKNIPEPLFEILKAQAKMNHRSINSEIIYSLKKMLGIRDEVETEKILKQARDLRQEVQAAFSEEEVNKVKTAGRQ